ncbi:protein SPIRAL1-like 1 isoform X2 [Brassica rapa]|uniref:protein SPIRAL1-like 1 isoform X2 n=1 Tax=Brassica campestris TaxID=3711 RepID=UPI00142D72EF|nr:protein SPIRAL1-like 1 isoform X2 [Brassica rapa]
MGRGVSAGGGQSSLGYLFGSGEAPKPAVNSASAETQPPPPSTTQPKTVAPKPVDITKQGPAGLNSNSANNYMRADGQNSGPAFYQGPLSSRRWLVSELPLWWWQQQLANE